jgi:predicted nucleic acid-binding protein
MKAVIDASVAMKWVIPEEGSEAASQLRQLELIAPSIWLAEVANGLWRHVLRRELDAEVAEQLLSEFMWAPVAIAPIERDLAAAFRLANDLSYPIYDCLYLAAAQREDTHVITADGRFFRACSKNAKLSERVRLLGE